MEYKVAFEKFITYKGENIFKLVKTKTNKYMLIDCKTKEILATTKKNILKEIKDYGEKIGLGGLI